MVSPILSSESPKATQCDSTVMDRETNGCSKCEEHSIKIQRLEQELSEAKEAEKSMRQNVETTFEAFENEVQEHEIKDALIAELQEQLQQVSARLDNLNKEIAAKKATKAMEDFKKEIIADKKTLQLSQWDVEKLEEENKGQRSARKTFVAHLVKKFDEMAAKKVYMEPGYEFNAQDNEPMEPSSGNICSAFDNPFEAEAKQDHYDSMSNQDNLDSEESFCVIEEEGNDSEHLKQDLVAELEKTAAERDDLKDQLKSIQDSYRFVKSARGKTNTILNNHFQKANSSYNFLADQNQQLRYDVEWAQQILQDAKQQYAELQQNMCWELNRLRQDCANKEKENQCLRIQLDGAKKTTERFSRMLAESNRLKSENRSEEVQKLRETVSKQVEHYKEIAEEKKELQERLTKTEEDHRRKSQKYKQLERENSELRSMLQALQDGAHSGSESDSSASSDPQTPRTPPRSPENPKTPMEEELPTRKLKRRSNDTGSGDEKKRRN